LIWVNASRRDLRFEVVIKPVQRGSDASDGRYDE
jgi:hypothetical protein